MNETKTVRLPKRAGVVAAVVGLSAVGLVTVASGFPASAQVMKPGDRVWECHYGKTGTDAEFLVKSNNPRSVSWKLADVNGDGQVSVGNQYLAAGGNRIYVVQINGESPGRDACPAAVAGPLPTGTKTNSGYTSPPPTTTTTTTKPPYTSPPPTTSTTPPPTTSTTPPVTTPPTTPPVTTSTTPPVTTPPTTPPVTTSTTPPVTTPPTTPPVTTSTTPPVTTSTTPPVTTPPTTPPVTTSTTPPVTTPPTTPPVTTSTTPPVTTPPTTPPVTTSTTPPVATPPGYGPPGTGGAGSSNPANLAVGSGLLLLAGAITITDVAARRRRATTGK